MSYFLAFYLFLTPFECSGGVGWSGGTVSKEASDHEIQDSPCTKKMREGGPASLSSHLEESTTEGTCPSTSMVFDFDRNSFPCLVKVYDSLEADLKLNDVFEFVGVLTFDLEPSVDKDDSDEFTSTLCKDELSHSPPSKENASIFGNRLNFAVKKLMPFTHFIPLTVDYLNTASLSPKKDYETNRLVSGVLQLAEGSHIMIDETHLQAGTLNSVGVENVRLIKNLMDLLEAIDLILQGAQNLVVPIKSNSRRKLQESPTAHNGCEFC
ncbi:hypothetical protein TEA_008426 [Camellia sinensis var. sinensis]|uniref:Uncharacterized protein n=1 Tax=Camellia sinensis var. sinensis TaxID=542762 RepID=A0A4S4EZK4_CAMSN|nr:hypothetical protein TEA_008426 [Camellia sinensis var. sinensis]